jgi:hypothetical protein
MSIIPSNSNNNQLLSPPATGSGASPSQGGLAYDQVINYWIQAGGNPQAAQMAAAVADASSALNPSATRTNPDGTTSVGLWLIPQNGSPPGSTDPLSNARAAVQLSNNGTDWSQWCVAWSDNNCGVDGGSYLGDGSNALGSLASLGGTFSFPGATPTGSGTGASSATGTTPTTKSNLSSYLIIILIIGVVAVVWWSSRRKEGSEESQSRSQAPWSPEEESQLNSDISDKELSQQTGRSIRAIRVRRNQKKSG